MLREKSARAAAENLAAVLREADLRKDEFLATLGHELRNPLGPLSHGLQILNRISSQDPVIQKTRDMMARQIECLVRLVDDLLDVGRVTQGKIVLQKQCVDLRDVVRRAVEGGGLHIDERGHKLELRMSDKPLPVDVDVIRIAQIVTNLLSNAAKFTNPGSGLIQLDCEQSGAEAVVRLRDNGRGIAPEMLPKIFDLFTQADPTESRTEGGLGIGLTLARRLAEMHGGRLEASSKGLAQGSEFVLRLPLADSRELAPVNASGTKPVSARNKTARHRILIVDDNEDSAQSLLTLLDILGHDVRQANSGTLALELAAEFVPDVVLLDLGMPGMSGYDVARAFQTQSNLRDLCIIALSGYGSEEDRRRTHSAGFYHHLVKPIDFAALESVLASLPAKA
jgi:CheY-like chemotaxis protein/nitrogen-specific signal transduction histidine kinase